MEMLNELDYQLLVYIYNLGSGTWDGFWSIVTNKYASFPIFGLVTWLIFKKEGMKSTLINIAFIGAMVVTAYVISNLFKYGIARPRPCTLEKFQDFFIGDKCGTFGFFSSHATTSMAIAIFIGLTLKPYYKIATIAMVIWAILVSYSRIFVGKHYPGDVIVGLIVGALIGFLFIRLKRIIVAKYKLLETDN